MKCLIGQIIFLIVIKVMARDKSKKSRLCKKVFLNSEKGLKRPRSESSESEKERNSQKPRENKREKSEYRWDVKNRECNRNEKRERERNTDADIEKPNNLESVETDIPNVDGRVLAEEGVAKADRVGN
jgi:hypothetical protein